VGNIKLIVLIILSAAVILFNGCSSRNTPVSQSESEAPKVQTIAVPQVEVVETPRFKELKRQFEAAENAVSGLVEERKRLLIVYTEEYSKVKKISRELVEAKEKLRIVESLLNVEREKLEYRLKNSPV